ncbi:permease [Bacillus sp. B190/17]|uniref:Permease n=1 Tax=Bacillus lumedeiriae TaxID=3058829 RepID=A0ABW8IAB7_9BACI
MAERIAVKNKKDEQKEDYALSKVPFHWRMSWPSISNVTMGVVTAMFFMQVSGQMALAYGSINALLAGIYATVITGVLATIIAYFSAKSGLNANLMARGAGYGFVGSALTSVIYAANFIMFCGIEGAIMANAIHAYIPAIPVWVYMILVGVGVIPLNWYGMKQLDKFQKYSLPVYLILLITGIILALNLDLPYSSNWLAFMPVGGEVGGVALLTCVGMMNAVVGSQTLLTSDYARFIKHDQIKIGAFAVGFLPQLVAFFVMGLIGIWFGVRFGESNPGVYMVTVMGVLGAAYTILTQLRINVTNLYSGSLALSNFFARVFHFAPGRVFWVIITSIAAVLTMIFGIVDHLGAALTFQGVFNISWVASLLADLLIVKKVLKLGPAHIEHRRGFLRDWNPVGPIALVVAAIVGTCFAFGLAGPSLVGASAFVAGAIAFTLHILLAVLTKGKYYLAQSSSTDKVIAPSKPNEWNEVLAACSVCHDEFVVDDMIYCSFITNNICSQCCASHATCNTHCQTENAVDSLKQKTTS